MFSADDFRYMAHALRLAENGLYSTTPNPRVGCVIVKNGRVVGEGWHVRAGLAHAEINALNIAKDAACGAVAYVTLEPCSHYGKTPPCAEALIAAGVARVVSAMEDPNPQVSGRGMNMLASAGVLVESGLLEAEARALNVGFVSRMTRGRPWVRMKMAASLDGRTALDNGASQWITGEAARQDGHRWRARACAMLTGMGTVLADNPRLNVRGVDTDRQPLKVVVDSAMDLPLDAALISHAPVLLAVAVRDAEKERRLTALGVECFYCPNAAGQVNLPALMEELGRRGINEVHVEAGAGLSGALLDQGLVDELLFYFAPCLLGSSARGMLALPLMTDLANKHPLELTDVAMVGRDLRVLARVAC